MAEASTCSIGLLTFSAGSIIHNILNFNMWAMSSENLPSSMSKKARFR